MDWYKQRATYYNDPLLLAAGEEAEVLHQRAKGYAADAESGGFIPAAAVPMITPKRPTQRAAKLVEQGLWRQVPGGYLILDWSEEQSELEALAERRRADRERKRAQRDRDRTTSSDAESRDKSVDSSRDSHADESREKFEHKRVRVRVREKPKSSPSSAGADEASSEAEPKRKPRTVPPGFDAFWAHYPRRVGRIAAEKAYAKALTMGATAELLAEMAALYARASSTSEPQFVKHPATWLNAGCWEDEPAPSHPASPPPHNGASAYRPVAEVLAEQERYHATPDDDPWQSAPHDPGYEPPF